MSLRQNIIFCVVELFSFNYQSECHCAKTNITDLSAFDSLITSQNVTAPKLGLMPTLNIGSLITSQNVTAPKHQRYILGDWVGLITSQNVTAPKRLYVCGR